MGAAIGRVLVEQGHVVHWCSDDRSDASRARATEAGLTDAGSLASCAAAAELLISIVPPHAAHKVARHVLDAGFTGTFVDANAIAPVTARAIAEEVEAAGVRYVDGSLIGPPPRASGDTRFYVSGDGADVVAGLFDGSIVDVRVLDEHGVAASAIKMCFAAWTKGTAAMLANIQELARAEGVHGALFNEWEASIPELPARCRRIDARAHEKAWRFIGEMDEIAAAFGEHELPDGFHRGAASVYRSIAARAAKKETQP